MLVENLLMTSLAVPDAVGLDVCRYARLSFGSHLRSSSRNERHTPHQPSSSSSLDSYSFLDLHFLCFRKAHLCAYIELGSLLTKI